jgi:hypothetical protein
LTALTAGGLSAAVFWVVTGPAARLHPARHPVMMPDPYP